MGISKDGTLYYTAENRYLLEWERLAGGDSWIGRSTHTAPALTTEASRVGDEYITAFGVNWYNCLKVIVLQKPAGVESGLYWKVFLSHWTRSILYFISKGNLLFELQKPTANNW